MGGYERHCAPWSLGRHWSTAIPPDFNGRLLEEDWERFEEIALALEAARAGDGRRQGHEAHQRPRGVHARQRVLPRGDRGRRASSSRPGFCAHGLAGAGGIGKVMAEWIVAGEPQLDLWHMDIRRFGPHYRSPAYTLTRTKEIYETYYDINYPGHERAAGRPLRVSSVYAWHAEHGAAFGEKSGWERVNWYESNAADGDEALRPRGWAGLHWSPAIGAEHRACPRARRAVRRVLVRQARGRRAGRGRVPGVAVRQQGRARRRAASPTRRCSTRAAGSSATSPSRGWPRRRFQIVTGTAFGQHDRVVDHAPRAARRQRDGDATRPRAGRASRSGGRGRATSSRR